MKIRIFTIIGVLAILAMWACKKDEGKQPVTTVTPAINTCDTVTYEKHIKSLINAQCAYCHNSSSSSPGPDFTNYSSIKDRALNGKLKTRAIDGAPPSMPPANATSRPTAAQLELLKCWINNGTKEK